MTRRFHFADAFWFRVPLRAVVVAMAVFALLSLWPAILQGSPDDRQRAVFGLVVAGGFVVMASIFAVAVDDGHVEVDGETLRIRFEAFFHARVPLADVVAVRAIDPQPRWRYRFGLSTDFVERIACSHGGPLVEIELARACETKLWPRRIRARRFWLGLREHDEFLALMRGVTAPGAGSTGARAA